MRIPKALRRALDDTGLPWTIEAGRRHKHLYLRGRMIIVLPNSGRMWDGGDPRSIKNNIAEVRRVARELGAS